MAPAGPEMRRLQGGRGARPGATVPMILDRGDVASVAAVCLGRTPHLGMRFEYGGTAWEVTHAEDHLRGWVAEPVARPKVAPFSPARPAHSRHLDGHARGACSHV